MTYSGKRSILIVEDSLDDQFVLSKALQAASVPMPLVFVRDVREAQDYLALQETLYKNPPCLILLDLSLPVYGGLEFLQDLRSDPATRRIPVIVLTGSVEETDLFQSYQYGANSYISKSGDLTEFYDKIKTLCRYWLGVCQLPV